MIVINQNPQIVQGLKAMGVFTPPAGEIYLTPDGWHYVSIATVNGVRSLWIIYSSSQDSRADIQIAIQVAKASGATRLLAEVPPARIPFYTRLGFTQPADFGHGVLEYLIT